jgi:hypothetical protein
MRENKKITLRSWMWRAFAQSALIPLVLVETVLIAVYLLTNGSIRDAQIEHLRQTALAELKSTAQQEAQLVSERLKTITQLTRLYDEQVQSVLLRDSYRVDALERQRHVHTADGVLFTQSDDGRAASFYANSTPQGKQDLDKVMRLAQLDPLMKSIQSSNTLVSPPLLQQLGQLQPHLSVVPHARPISTRYGHPQLQFLLPRRCPAQPAAPGDMD